MKENVKKLSANLRQLAVAIVIMILGILQFPISVYATTYYVAKDGNNNWSGLHDSPQGNPQTDGPWLTIPKAAYNLRPGDTVYIRAGEYESDYIVPSTSGTSGQYIVYKNYPSEVVTIKNGINQINLDNRSYIIIDGLEFRDAGGNWITMNGTEHCIIKNCHFEGNSAWAGIKMNGADYNKILNNTLIAVCGGGNDGPDDVIWCGESSYNLFEGNDFRYGTHNCFDMQGRGPNTTSTGNIIKNNKFYNPWHTALSLFYGGERNLVEGNVILDAGEACGPNTCPGNACGSERDRTQFSRMNHGGLQFGNDLCIIRKNVFVNNGKQSLTPKNGSGSEENAANNRIYNNTYYKNYAGLYSNTTKPVYGNIIKNNIFYKNRNYEIYRFLTGSPNNNYYFNNSILGVSPPVNWNNTKKGISYFESNYPNEWKDNLTLNPKFVSEVPDPNSKNSDLHLRSTSPMIDAGAFLTQTSSSGSGITISVQDASYFMDGWGSIEGDLIQLEGQDQTARITNVDYDNNIIVVDKSLSWNNSIGISLAYNGSAPDIGAYEYDDGIGVGIFNYKGFNPKTQPIFTIYPNPSNGKCIIRMNSDSPSMSLNKLRVYSILGILVDELEISNGEFLWNNSTAPNGIYLMKLVGSPNYLGQKLILVR